MTTSATTTSNATTPATSITTPTSTTTVATTTTTQTTGTTKPVNITTTPSTTTTATTTTTTTTPTPATTTPVNCSLLEDGWIRKTDIAAPNGVFYGWTSESNCKAVCLSSPTCVAIDRGSVSCVLHHSTANLAGAFAAPGVTQFVLIRQCLPTTSSAGTQ